MLLDKQTTDLHEEPVMVAFINGKSGGQQGSKVKRLLQRLLPEGSVFDLSEGGPQVGLEKFADDRNRLRVIACGGDGTVCWVMSILDKLNWDIWPSIAVLPLGTGNDMARVLMWGPGWQGESLEKYIDEVKVSKVLFLDRWKVRCVPLTEKQMEKYEKFRPKDHNSETSSEDDEIEITQYLKQLPEESIPSDKIPSFPKIPGEEYYYPEKENLPEKEIFFSEIKDKETTTTTVHEIEIDNITQGREDSTGKWKDYKKKPPHSKFIEEEDNLHLRKTRSSPEKENGKLSKSKKNKKEGLVKSLTRDTSSSHSPTKTRGEATTTEEDPKKTLPLATGVSRILGDEKPESENHDFSDLPVISFSVEEKVMSPPTKNSSAPTGVKMYPKKETENKGTPHSEPNPKEKSLSERSRGENSTSRVKNSTDKIFSESFEPKVYSPRNFENTGRSRTRSPERENKRDSRKRNNSAKFGSDYSEENRQRSKSPGPSLFRSNVKYKNKRASERRRDGKSEKIEKPEKMEKMEKPEIDQIPELPFPPIEESDGIPDMDVPPPPAEEREFVLNNYFSIGIDGRVCLDFHNFRNKNPELFRNRIINYGWYGAVGLKSAVTHWTPLHRSISLRIDGQHIALKKKLLALVILNIPSYGGGADLWGQTVNMTKWSQQDISDGVFEVLGIRGAFHLGQIQGKMAKGVKIAQGRQVKILCRTPIEAQMDGEPFMLLPSKITVKLHNRAPVLLNKVKDKKHKAEMKLMGSMRDTKKSKNKNSQMAASLKKKEIIEVNEEIVMVKKNSKETEEEDT